MRAIVAAFLAILLINGFTRVGLSQTSTTQDWTGVDNNYPLNWNYSPQNTINQGNVGSLQVAWTFPVPDAPTVETSAVGVMVTPLLVEGVLYCITNWGAIIALDAQNGNALWLTNLPLQQNFSQLVQPSVPPSLGIPLGHYHQMIYTTHIRGQPLIWVVANTYQVFAVNAYSGDIVVNFNPLAANNATIPGNYGIFDQDTPNILIDDSRGILLFGPSDSEGESSGRGFLEGWAVNGTEPRFLWRTFIMPPQDGSDPAWSLDSVGNMSHAYIFNGTSALDLKSLSASALRLMLEGDWGTMGFDGYRSYAGVSPSWGGSWALDQGTGVAFVGTNTATPDWNGTQRPGPDLWSDSVLAVDVENGSIDWGFQGMAHPLGDLDCSWNVVLANETVAGRVQPVVLKGCKDGYVFELSASTGALVWYLKPPAVDYIAVQVFNPLNQTQMTKVNWYGYPKTGIIVQNPSDTGSLESDLAYDPAQNLLFLVTYNEPKDIPLLDVGTSPSVPFSYSNWEFDWGANELGMTMAGPLNSTVAAVDAADGAIKWSYTIQGLPFRGGVTVSGGVVYVPLLDGKLLVLDEGNGTRLLTKNIGGELLAQPAIGEDANGTSMIFLTDMGSSRWGPVFAGFVQALSLQAVRSNSGGTSAVPYFLVGGAGVLCGAVGAGCYQTLRRRGRAKDI